MFIYWVGIVIFRSDDMAYACKYWKNMFGITPILPENIVYSFTYYIDTFEIIMIIVAILCSAPLFKNMLNVENKWAKAGINIWLLVLFFLSTVTMAGSTYNPFIYFRF